MNIKNISSTPFIRTVLRENISVFPLLVVVFLVFALTEEFLPGFFTFYISQWWFIVPVLFSGILFYFSDIDIADNRDVKSSSFEYWKKWGILAIFQGLFSLGFWWKMKDLPLWLYIIMGSLFFILFLLFQVALLFEEDEIKKSTDFLRRQKSCVLLGVLIVLAICCEVFFIWYLLDPYFYSDILSLENIKNFLEIQSSKTDTLAP